MTRPHSYDPALGYNTAGYSKEEWVAHLQEGSDIDLRKACAQYIWLSAYANNNPRSAYHWMCDAAYDEAKRRDKVNIYNEEHTALMREAQGRR